MPNHRQSCHWGLNPGPLPYQGSALPLSYGSGLHHSRGRYRVPARLSACPKLTFGKPPEGRPNRDTFGAYRNCREGKSIFLTGRVSNARLKNSAVRWCRNPGEIRNPKPEIRRKEENPKSKRTTWPLLTLPLAEFFGFRASDFLRISGFGFRIFPGGSELRIGKTGLLKQPPPLVAYAIVFAAGGRWAIGSAQRTRFVSRHTSRRTLCPTRPP